MACKGESQRTHARGRHSLRVRCSRLGALATPLVATIEPVRRTKVLQSELDAAREERGALPMLKREKEERERAEVELALAYAPGSAEKKAQLAAAKARVDELRRTPTAQCSPTAPKEPKLKRAPEPEPEPEPELEPEPESEPEMESRPQRRQRPVSPPQQPPASSPRRQPASPLMPRPVSPPPPRNATSSDRKARLPRAMEGTPARHDTQPALIPAEWVQRINTQTAHIQENGRKEILSLAAASEETARLPRAMEGTPARHDAQPAPIPAEWVQRINTQTAHIQEYGRKEILSLAAASEETARLPRAMEGTPVHHGSESVPAERKQRMDSLGVTMCVVRAKIRFVHGLHRHQSKRINLYLSLFSLVLLIGICLMSLTMRDAGLNAILTQLSHIGTVGIKAMAVEVEGFLSDQSTAALAVRATIQRGDIALSAGYSVADEYLLAIVDAFELSSVSVVVPAMGTLAATKDRAGDAWISYSDMQTGCTKSWSTRGLRRSRDMSTESTSATCDFVVPQALSDMSDDLSWLATSYSRSKSTCTSHICGETMRGEPVIGAASSLMDSTGSNVAIVVAERSTESMNSRLDAILADSFDSQRSSVSPHIWIMDVATGTILASTNPQIATDLVAGAVVQLKSHPAMHVARDALFVQNGTYVASAALPHLPETPEATLGFIDWFLFFGFFKHPQKSLIKCSDLSQPVADRPEGWVLCLQVDHDYWLSLIFPTACSTVGVAVLHLSLLVASSNAANRRSASQQKIQFLCILSALVSIFVLWDMFTRKDIMVLIDDLVEHAIATVARKTSILLTVPEKALALLHAHRNLGTLIQGNTSVAEVQQGDALYLDVLRLYPELYMAYSGISYATSDHDICSLNCYCDRANDRSECCLALPATGHSSYHCAGLADDRYAFFHGAKRYSPGDQLDHFEVTARDLWALDKDDRMLRRDYAARMWQRGVNSGRSRDFDTVKGDRYYNPVARSWFSDALESRGWSSIYLFSTPHPTTGERPLGISAMLTSVASQDDHDASVPSGASSDKRVAVDAVDFTLQGIGSFLSTIEFSPASELEGVAVQADGVIFIMELDGKLIGTSDQAASTISYYEGAAQQRVSCPSDSSDTGSCTTSGSGEHLVSPIIRLAHRELLVRFGTLHELIRSGANETFFVGHGHEEGPLAVRTVLIESSDRGVQWLLCVALKSDSLLRPFSDAYSTALMTALSFMLVLILMFKGLSLVDANDIVDRRWPQVWHKCRRPRRSTEARDSSGLLEFDDCVSPPRDLGGFCETRRQQLLVDIEVAGLLATCKRKEEEEDEEEEEEEEEEEAALPLGEYWDPELWLENLFIKTSTFFGGPAYLRSILGTKKAARGNVDTYKVAQMLLHFGYVERGTHRDHVLSSGDSSLLDDGFGASLNLALMDQLKLFLSHTRDEEWMWDRIKSREVQQTTVSAIINRKQLFPSRLEGAPIETQHFIYANFSILEGMSTFWAHAAECVKKAEHDHSTRFNLLNRIDVNQFQLRSVGLKCRKCKWQGKRPLPNCEAQLSKRKACDACRPKRDMLDEYLRFVMAVKEFLNMTHVVRKFLQNCPDDCRDPWSVPPDMETWGGTKDDNTVVREFMSIVRKHCQERCAPLWRDWIRRRPIQWDLDAKNDEALDELTECLQGIGYTGTKSALQPLFKAIRRHARNFASFSHVARRSSSAEQLARSVSTEAQAHRLLSAVSGLDCVPEEALLKLSRHFKRKTIDLKATVIVKDDSSTEMYIIETGKALAGPEEGNEANVFAELTTGDIFGEGGAIDGSPRNCFVWNASTTEKLELLAIGTDALKDVIKQYPSLRKSILAMGIQRRKATGDMHTDFRDWNRCIKFLSSGNYTFCTIHDLCRWELQDQRHRSSNIDPYRISRFKGSANYSRFNYVVSVLHMALTLVEAPSGDTPLTLTDTERLQAHKTFCILLGGCIIATYWVDIALSCAIHGGVKRYERPPATQPSLPAEIPQLTLFQKTARLSKGRESEVPQLTLIALIVVIGLLTVDWGLQLLFDYSTEPTPRDSLEQDLVLLIPYSAILRPVVLVLRSKPLRHGASSFVRTLVHSGTIFLLFLIILAASGVTGMILFANERSKMYGDVFLTMSYMFTYVSFPVTRPSAFNFHCHKHQECAAARVLSCAYPGCWYTMQMTTAENWPDAVWGATECDSSGKYVHGNCAKYFFHLYFWTASFVGTIIMVSLMIATFESKYTEQHRAEAEQRRARRLESIVAAYLVLDRAGHNHLTVKEIGEFLAACGLNHVKLGRRGQRILLKLNVSEFASVLEQLEHEVEGCKATSMLTEELVEIETKKIQRRSEENLQGDAEEDSETSPHQPRFVNSNLHEFLMSVVSLVHLGGTACMNTGLLFFGIDVDIISSICVCMFHADCVARVRAAGSYSDFWNVPSSVFDQSKNRYDAWISALSVAFLGLAAAQLIFEVPQSEFAASTSAFLGLDPWNRIALALPVLRLFSGPKSIRIIWFCLSSILPQYSHVVALGAIGLYCFGCVGCWLLAFRFHYLGPDVYEIPQANFNGMLDSITTLFQLFIGEAWDSVKQAAVDSNGGFVSELFFLVYVLTMTVLFVNLLSGVILSSWEVVATVIETERRQSTVSVRQFQLLAAHQDISTQFEIQFEGARDIRVVPSISYLFGSADTDGSGTITRQELARQIGEKAAADVWGKVQQLVDVEEDGEVTLEDLKPRTLEELM
eukprot:COSAG02_NODE_78_length_40609_cov_19.893730_2_plen_2704_part_00